MHKPVPETTESATQTEKRPLFSRWWVWFILICLVAVGASILWKKQQPAATTAGKSSAKAPSLATPVFVSPARKGDMNVYLTGLGTVTTLNNVTVRSRVDGQLMEVYFRDGQSVAKGSLLALIDPRPYQVLLTQAEGQIARDRELLVNARLDLERYRILWKQDSIPRQQLETQESLVRQYEAAVKVDGGQIDSAKLQLTYCRITAPFSGQAGLGLVNPGNIVHATDVGGLLTITQMQPISVQFPIPEDSLPQVLRKMKGGRLAVEAFDREMKQKLATGELSAVDNQIDPTTGTVKLKALFANRDRELFPNQFVNARLLLEVQKDAIIIPSAAIQKSPQGAFVFVLAADKTVAMKQVKTGISQGGETSITEGLEAGEQVVVDGAERLRDGSKVEVKQKDQPNKNGKDAKSAGKPDKQQHGRPR